MLLYPQSGGLNAEELISVLGMKVFTVVVGGFVDGSTVEGGEGFLLKGQQTRGVDPM